MGQAKARGPRLGLIAIVALTMAVVWAADVFLARMESSELAGEARHDYDQGVALLRAGNAPEAVDLLRKAHSIERGNSAYQVQLAQALIDSGKFEEAESSLSDLLQKEPNNGDANLLQARLMVREGKNADAISYYHRAIFGIWNAQAAQRRIATRLELAQYLASRGDKTDLLSEILPLQTETQEDPKILEQIGALYLQAGSPARAQSTYQDLIRANPKDAENYVGLGNAELALGNYHGAELAYQTATRLGGGEQIASRKQLAETMAELDPTVRWLTSSEKYHRSMKILQLARDALKACAKSPDAMQMIADVDKVLAEKIKGPMNNETAEDRLSLAEELWQTRLSSCGPSTWPAEEPLRLVMAKLAQ